MHKKQIFILFSGLLALIATCGACGAEVFVRDDIITEPRPGLFSVCHGFTCAVVSQIGVTQDQWNWITSAFKGRAPDAATERSWIAQTVGRFEVIVGEITGTSDDRAENDSGMDWSLQMDCIDESTNTTNYLYMLQAAGLMQWHRVADRVTRGYFLFGMPHTTAVVTEVPGGAHWAVDSWFFANGVPPVIVPLERWRETRWRPAARP